MLVRMFVIATSLVVVGSSLSCLADDTLWSRRKARRVHRYRDTQARAPGDLITILVVENTSIANQDQRALSKDSSAGAKLAFSGSTAGDLGAATGNADLDHKTSSDRDFRGDSRFSSNRGFTDQLTVSVQSILPNGNLWVAGRRQVLVEGDVRSLIVSGIVRPIDVRADNTIRSQLVADLRVKYCGRGAESRFTRQGWFNRRLNRFWPF